MEGWPHIEVAPDRIGDRYRVVAPIGDGGCGTVYEAIHDELGKRVAIKLMKRAHPLEDGSARRFAREARIAAQIDHPNIVKVLDYGIDPEVGPYLVMELLTGDRLDDELVIHRVLTLREVLEWLEPIGQALDAIHALGLVHRDVKPENIIRAHAGDARVVKLVDFGLAIHTDGRDRITRRGSISGTPQYLAPEVVEGSQESIASDVYSLAVVAYELLTGELPHKGDTAIDVMKRKLTERPPSLTERTGRLFSVKLEMLFEAGLHVTPGERPASATELIAQMRACQRRS